MKRLLVAVAAGLILSAVIAGAVSAESLYLYNAERNEHGLVARFTNGESVSFGVSGDAIRYLPGGIREYGYWNMEGDDMVARFRSGRIVTLYGNGPKPKTSGYCILRGQVVPDFNCY